MALCTALNKWHSARGATMIDFAGWNMPLRYKDLSITDSHKHTRSQVSLFDVSHMRCIDILGPKKVPFLDSVLPSAIDRLPVGKSKVSILTNSQGGIEDDFMITSLSDRLRLVVNACNNEKDLEWLATQLERSDPAVKKGVYIEPINQSILSLQGPLSEPILKEFLLHCKANPSIDLENLYYMSAAETSLMLLPNGRRKMMVSRSGYTGEDGFELFMDDRIAEIVADMLASHPALKLAGLGARDSLRQEAGYCLYGHELKPDITPAMAGLTWMLSKAKLLNKDNFIPGQAIMLNQLQNPTNVPMKRIGLRASVRGLSAREGCKVYQSSKSDEPIGEVTSGCMSPMLNAAIAIAYVQTQFVKSQELWIESNGKRRAYLPTRFPMVGSRMKTGPPPKFR